VLEAPGPGSRSTSTFPLLRAHTRGAHERLEARMATFAWLASLETYGAMLDSLFGFYSAVEPELVVGAASITGLNLGERAKTPLLIDDLLSLGRSPAQLVALPRATGILRLDEPSRALGALYVLEGATLGGKVIEREAQRRLGLDRRAGTAFFGAYGSDVGRRWREFRDVLEREARALEAGVMLDAASETFTAVERWLPL
jgi:heme oxygenase